MKEQKTTHLYFIKSNLRKQYSKFYIFCQANTMNIDKYKIIDSNDV